MKPIIATFILSLLAYITGYYFGMYGFIAVILVEASFFAGFASGYLLGTKKGFNLAGEAYKNGFL